MYVIVGLGNPGRRYENTKHNVGFITLDQIAEKHSIKIEKKKHKALIGEGRIGSEKVILVKPQTYMNLSGQSVSSIFRYYSIAPENLIVIYDDIDIPLGSIRIRQQGGPGTHNGMRSIINLLLDDSFPRVRIGIGSERGEVPLANFVTSGFGKENVETIETAILRAVDAVDSIINDGIVLAMTKYNG